MLSKRSFTRLFLLSLLGISSVREGLALDFDDRSNDSPDQNYGSNSYQIQHSKYSRHPAKDHTNGWSWNGGPVHQVPPYQQQQPQTPAPTTIQPLPTAKPCQPSPAPATTKPAGGKPSPAPQYPPAPAPTTPAPTVKQPVPSPSPSTVSPSSTQTPAPATTKPGSQIPVVTPSAPSSSYPPCPKFTLPGEVTPKPTTKSPIDQAAPFPSAAGGQTGSPAPASPAPATDSPTRKPRPTRAPATPKPTSTKPYDPHSNAKQSYLNFDSEDGAEDFVANVDVSAASDDASSSPMDSARTVAKPLSDSSTTGFVRDTDGAGISADAAVTPSNDKTSSDVGATNNSVEKFNTAVQFTVQEENTTPKSTTGAPTAPLLAGCVAAVGVVGAALFVYRKKKKTSQVVKEDPELQMMTPHDFAVV